MSFRPFSPIPSHLSELLWPASTRQPAADPRPGPLLAGWIGQTAVAAASGVFR